MSQLNIQEQKKKVTLYRIGDKDFRSQEEAEQYIRESQDAVNRVYYDVIYDISHDYIPPQYTSRCLIGVPKEDHNNNPYLGIAWIPAILRYINRTNNIDYKFAEDWKIVQRYEVYTIEELLNIAKYDGFDIKEYQMTPGDETDIILTYKGAHYQPLRLPQEVMRE